MKTVLATMLIAALVLLHTAGRESFAATEEKAVSSQNKEASTEAAKPEKTKADESKPEPKKAEPAPAPSAQSKFISWEADVWAPIIRLAAIVFILGALIWFLDLPSVMRAEAWSERTIMAFAIVFTYCAAALMGAMALPRSAWGRTTDATCPACFSSTAARAARSWSASQVNGSNSRRSAR